MPFDQLQRRAFVALLGGSAVAWPLAGRAQQPGKPVIGFLSSLSPGVVARPLAAFRQTLREAGYEEGKAITVEYRWAEGHYDRLPGLAVDLVRQQAAVIVAIGGDSPALAVKAATATIPIVFVVGRDPVRLGLVASLNRPAGNATGVNILITEIESKRVELLRQLVPAAAKLAVLANPKGPETEAMLNDLQSVARSSGQPLEVLNASSESEIDAAFRSLKEAKIGGLLVSADPFFATYRDQIILRASQNAIPAIYPIREFADSGGLISYGAPLVDAYQQVAAYVARILKGANPAELPVAQPTKFELVINLKAAKALQVTLPQIVLMTADEVIE